MGIHTIGYSLTPLGGLLLGAMAQSTGPGKAVLLAAGIYLVILSAIWLFRTDLKHLRQQSD